MQFDLLKRREFITLLGGSAVGWPLAARAQQPGERRIGALMSMVESDPEAHARVAAFRQGLREIGWIEGRNIRIEFRWAADDTNLMRAYAAELVGSAPDVIVVHAPPPLAAVQQQTRSLPIVFVQVPDPVGGGFVASLSRPGGNTTGSPVSRTPSVRNGSNCSRRLFSDDSGGDPSLSSKRLGQIPDGRDRSPGVLVGHSVECN